MNTTEDLDCKIIISQVSVYVFLEVFSILQVYPYIPYIAT